MGVRTAPTGVVCIIDDDRSVREAIDRLMRSVGLQGELFATAHEFLRAQRAEIPACLVLDVRLPGMSGLELQQFLAERGDKIPIIFITGHADVQMAVQAMKAGAVDFLTKPFRDQDLLDAIQHAIEGDQTVRQRQAEVATLQQLWESLTLRERQIFALVARGLPNKRIAVELGASEHTIKAHRAKVMEKMKAGSLADLVRMADKLGIHSNGSTFDCSSPVE
jgi:FixJ family two-component response regulator